MLKRVGSKTDAEFIAGVGIIAIIIYVIITNRQIQSKRKNNKFISNICFE